MGETVQTSSAYTQCDARRNRIPYGMSEGRNSNTAAITRTTSQSKETPVCINCATCSEELGVVPSRTSRLLSWFSGWMTRRGHPKSKETGISSTFLTQPASEWVYLPSPAGLSPIKPQWSHSSEPKLPSKMGADTRLANYNEVETTSDEEYPDNGEEWRLVRGFLQHSPSQLHRQQRTRQMQYLSALQLGSSTETIPHTLMRSHSMVNDWMTLGVCPYRRRQHQRRHKLSFHRGGNNYRTFVIRRRNRSPDNLNEITYSRSSLSKLPREASSGLYWKYLEHLTGESCSSIYDAVEKRCIANNDPKSLRNSYSADALTSFSHDHRLPGLGVPFGVSERSEPNIYKKNTGLISRTSSGYFPALVSTRGEVLPSYKEEFLNSDYHTKANDLIIKQSQKPSSLNRASNNHEAGRTYIKSKHPKLGEIHFYLNSIPESDGDTSTMKFRNDIKPKGSENIENSRAQYKVPFTHSTSLSQRKRGKYSQACNRSRSFNEDHEKVFNQSRLQNWYKSDLCFLHENSSTKGTESNSEKWLQSYFRDDHCFSVELNSALKHASPSDQNGLQDAVPKTVRDLKCFLDETDRTLLYRKMSIPFYSKPSIPSAQTDTLESTLHPKDFLANLSQYYLTYNLAARNQKQGKISRSFSDGHTIRSALDNYQRSRNSKPLRRQLTQTRSSTLSLSDSATYKSLRGKEKRRKLRIRRDLISTKHADFSDPDGEADDEGNCESSSDDDVKDCHDNIGSHVRDKQSAGRSTEYPIQPPRKEVVHCKKLLSTSCPIISLESQYQFPPIIDWKTSRQKKNFKSRVQGLKTSILEREPYNGEDGDDHCSVMECCSDSLKKTKDTAHMRAMTEKFDKYLKRFGENKKNTSHKMNYYLRGYFKQSPAEKARKRSVQKKVSLGDLYF